MPENLTGWSPAEIDTALFLLIREQDSKMAQVARNRAFIERTEESAFQARMYAERIEEAKAECVTLNEEISALRRQMRPYNEEYQRRGGWSRAWLVTNGNGHVHKTMECSTCYPTTEFFWLTEVSGLNEEEIVDRAGERACTVCYPSAPVEVLAKPTRLFSDDEKSKQRAREERARKAAEKEAKRIANSLTEDGSPLVVKAFGYTEYLTHQKTAMTWLTDHLAYYPQSVTDEDVSLVITALATKRCVSVEEIKAEVDKKVAKKRH